MHSLSTFKKRFVFNPEKTLYVGVERECFITNGTGDPSPHAHDVLACIEDGFSYELSACQIEGQTGPCTLGRLAAELAHAESSLHKAVSGLGLGVSHQEVAPATMPLDVYPDPTGRYQQLVRGMPRDRLLAACRIIGTHVHIGMPDHATALRVYNRVLKEVPRLCQEGDSSEGERLAIYKQVAPDCMPRWYTSWSDFHRHAIGRGFAEDPRRCWSLVRISVHGTVEFRMFGATPSRAKIVRWARQAHSLCADAM